MTITPDLELWAADEDQSVQRFLYACAFWLGAADENFTPQEQTWLNGQFGGDVAAALLEEFLGHAGTDFYAAFDAAVAGLDAADRKRVYPHLDAWLRAFSACDDKGDGAEDQVRADIATRIGLAEVLGETDEDAVEAAALTAGRQLVIHTDEVTAVTVLPDGGVLSGSEDHTVVLWDLESGKPRARYGGHAHTITGLAAHRDGVRWYACDLGGLVRCANLEGQVVWEHQLQRLGGATSVAVSGDARHVAVTTESGALLLLDGATGRVNRTLGRRHGALHEVDFSTDGRTLAVACDDRMVHHIETSMGAERGALEAHTDGVMAVRYSAAADLLASGGRDGAVCLWDMPAGELRCRIPAHDFTIHALAFGPPGVLASASWDHRVRTWSLDDGEALGVYEDRDARFNCLAWHAPSGMFVAGGSEGRVRLVPVQ